MIILNIGVTRVEATRRFFERWDVEEKTCADRGEVLHGKTETDENVFTVNRGENNCQNEGVAEVDEDKNKEWKESNRGSQKRGIIKKKKRCK